MLVVAGFSISPRVGLSYRRSVDYWRQDRMALGFSEHIVLEDFAENNRALPIINDTINM